jgi:hypothetical protein
MGVELEEVMDTSADYADYTEQGKRTRKENGKEASAIVFVGRLLRPDKGKSASLTRPTGYRSWYWPHLPDGTRAQTFFIDFYSRPN